MIALQRMRVNAVPQPQEDLVCRRSNSRHGMGLYFPYCFRAGMTRFGVGKVGKIYNNVLFLPDELRAGLPFDRYPRLRVEGEIAEVPITNAFMPGGDGRYYVIVAPQVFKDGEVCLGDEVDMRFRIADQERVEVPVLLSAAIGQHPRGAQVWQALTSGKRRMLVLAEGLASGALTETGKSTVSVRPANGSRGQPRPPRRRA